MPNFPGAMLIQGATFIPESRVVEKILKGSLNSIPSPSPSVKIQIKGGKVFLRWKGKQTLLGIVNKLLKTKIRAICLNLFCFNTQENLLVPSLQLIFLPISILMHFCKEWKKKDCKKVGRKYLPKKRKRKLIHYLVILIKICLQNNNCMRKKKTKKKSYRIL